MGKDLGKNQGNKMKKKERREKRSFLEIICNRFHAKCSKNLRIFIHFDYGNF